MSDGTIVRTKDGCILAIINGDANTCTCGQAATHWTAEMAVDGVFLLTWCDICWSLNDTVPEGKLLQWTEFKATHEVSLQQWMELKMVTDVHEV